MAAAHPRLLIIGLDAATFDVLDAGIAAGDLPALAGLVRRGASARCLSTPNAHSASAWTSILTGLNPGRHGIFVFSDHDFGSGRRVFFNGGDRTGATLADHLAAHGVSTGLLNVPMTYPARAAAGGFVVSGLDAPTLGDAAFSPVALRAEFERHAPGYQIAPAGLEASMRAGRREEAVVAWQQQIASQAAAAEPVLARHPVDCFMTVFTAGDWAGHNLWPRPGGAYDPDPCAAMSDPLFRAIYIALDRAVARLLSYASASAHVLVVSDHGMGPHSGASYWLAHWLADRGYLARRARSAPGDMIRAAGRRLRSRVRSWMGTPASAGPGLERDEFFSSIQWSRTTAYSEPGRHVININLAGRNAGGTVAPGDYDTLRRRLAAELAAWTDARGARVVERVALREELYDGPFVERASDLHVYWNRDAFLGEPPALVRSQRLCWTGDHTPEGVFIAAGPGIRPATRIGACRVYDILPTCCYLIDVPVPDGLDGRVVTGACTDEWMRARPIRFGSPGDAPRGPTPPPREATIEARLRALGYL